MDGVRSRCVCVCAFCWSVLVCVEQTEAEIETLLTLLILTGQINKNIHYFSFYIDPVKLAPAGSVCVCECRRRRRQYRGVFLWPVDDLAAGITPSEIKHGHRVRRKNWKEFRKKIRRYKVEFRFGRGDRGRR